MSMLVLNAWPANADCACACVDGEVVPLCESVIDLEPICAPRVCPITPPSIEPISPPTLAPLGTNSCHQEQVYNEYTGLYEWENICY